jgi:GNAT superfamily N-acetyltransferase
MFERAHGGTLAMARSFGGSDGAHLAEFPGVTAAVVPSCPERSVVNSVGYERAPDLEAALEDVAAAYDRAGIHAWTVWVPEADRDAAELLRGAGHKLDATPAAMGAALRDMPLDGPDPADWYRTDDVREVAPLNDIAYGYEDSFARALRGFRPDAASIYVARADGKPASCLMTLDRGGDRHIILVATTPEARGRGLASGLLSRALADGREAGLESTSLIATKLGTPIYERLGYRIVGAIEMWERRRS